MTRSLDTFAKVRALHDSTTSPGEKDNAAAKMEVLARSAGMTVEQAVSKLDDMAALAAQPRQTNFKDIFDTPFFRQQKADHERERSEKWRQVVAAYGSEEAVFAPRACYELIIMRSILLSMSQTKATMCRPASVLA